LNVLIIYMSDH